ncbi:mediator complex subunit intersex [Arctopsyche grandis]|uniref:mediator complex subunit intersex n=1 Tax=Arctopsyche grandis TaxID=121162 RepID=UPI00406D6623
MMNNMNMHGVPMNQQVVGGVGVGGVGVGVGVGGVGVGVGVGVGMQLQSGPVGVPVMMQQPSPQQLQQPMPPQPTQPLEKLDNISKVKSLVGPLRDSLTATLKSAAQVLHQNYLVDNGSQKGVDNLVPRFDKNMEEFYSICDQIELHLKTSIACLQQAGWASQNLPLAVLTSRSEVILPPEPPPSALSYPQFLTVARMQVTYAKEIHDTLIAAVQNISPTE